MTQEMHRSKEMDEEGMKRRRPEQALLTRDTDPGRTEDTRRVIEAMVDALNDHRIDDVGEFFAEDFVWRGNWGCGTKRGLAAFQDNWQRPFQAAFSGKVAVDEARLYMGEWAACFGAQHAVHSGEFMGLPPSGRKVEIRYMDFWKVQDGKIVENWVSVDFAHVMAQLGEDVFGGQGWEAFDRGEREPPRPAARASRTAALPPRPAIPAPRTAAPAKDARTGAPGGSSAAPTPQTPSPGDRP